MDFEKKQNKTKQNKQTIIYIRQCSFCLITNVAHYCKTESF